MKAPTLFARKSLAIETSEGVSFALPLAGPVSRFLAWIVDLLCILTACGILGKLLQLVGSLSADAMLAIATLAYFVVWIGYGIFFEWTWRGQTPGKRALGLRVVDASGLRLQFSQIALRNLLRALDALPGLYLVGGAAVLLTRRYQRLGDLVSNTAVIRKRQLSLPDLAVLAEPEKYNSFLDVPHLAARLRAQTSPDLAQLAFAALLRRDALPPATRVEIFRRLAARFQALVKFPDELTFPLTDERYVRNALQVLLLKKRTQTGTRKNALP